MRQAVLERGPKRKKYGSEQAGHHEASEAAATTADGVGREWHDKHDEMTMIGDYACDVPVDKCVILSRA